jgi:hypothetical protein
MVVGAEVRHLVRQVLHAELVFFLPNVTGRHTRPMCFAALPGTTSWRVHHRRSSWSSPSPSSSVFRWTWCLDGCLHRWVMRTWRIRPWLVHGME